MPHESLRIPQPAETAIEGCTIAATLELTEHPHARDKPRPIALILHGVMGHKDYLFLKRLAKNLPIDSCRFDFRGNHETPGSWSIGGMREDIQDIQAVVAYLTSQRGYKVVLVVAHSRGSVAAMRWAAETPEGQNIEGFVNVSSRKRMAHAQPVSSSTAQGGKSTEEELRSKGYYMWNARVAGKDVSRRVNAEDIVEFAMWDSNYIAREFPAQADVLTIHGLADTRVPPFDALLIARDLQNRPTATHSLHFIELADHNFIGFHDEVVDTILQWWDRKQSGLLRDGIWNPAAPTGVRSKM